MQGLVLELWGIQSPQGISNPEIKAISSTKNRLMEMDCDCGGWGVRGGLEIKKKFLIVKVIKAEIGYQRKS